MSSLCLYFSLSLFVCFWFVPLCVRWFALFSWSGCHFSLKHFYVASDFSGSFARCWIQVLVILYKRYCNCITDKHTHIAMVELNPRIKKALSLFLSLDFHLCIYYFHPLYFLYSSSYFFLYYIVNSSLIRPVER